EEAMLAREQGTGSEAGSPPEADAGPDTPLRRECFWGGREMQITDVSLMDERGAERHVYVPGERITVALSVHSAAEVRDFVFRAGIFTLDGISVYGTNTDIEKFRPKLARGDGTVTLAFESLSLVEGTYLLDVAVHKRDGTPYDYHRGL